MVRNPWKSSEMTVDVSSSKFSSSLLASVSEKDFSHSCLGFFEDLDPYVEPKLDFVWESWSSTDGGAERQMQGFPEIGVPKVVRALVKIIREDRLVYEQDISLLFLFFLLCSGKGNVDQSPI